ncbi:hypothetical protein [Paraburkholderia sp. MM6662-R1]|uniref:hypothetical protein n=1 Tax=Paraburkholderia sp. MM6662-R1 TaxID=2991066 RepID=UPI003D233A70
MISRNVVTFTVDASFVQIVKAGQVATMFLANQPEPSAAIKAAQRQGSRCHLGSQLLCFRS